MAIQYKWPQLNVQRSKLAFGNLSIVNTLVDQTYLVRIMHLEAKVIVLIRYIIKQKKSNYFTHLNGITFELDINYVNVNRGLSF